MIDWEIDTFTGSDLDYLSNTLMPTYSDGLDVEVVRTSVLTWAGANLTDPPEREHVTLVVYRRPGLFTLGNVLHSDDLSGLRWTVDTPEDLEFVREVYQRLYAVDHEFDLADVLAPVHSLPDLLLTATDGLRNAALKALDTGALKT